MRGVPSFPEGDGRGLDPPPEDPETGDAPAEILELVAAARDWVRLSIGTEPDATMDTLPLLDGYVARARASVEERPETVHLVARALGGYFGEVVRREIGGYWHESPGDVTEWTIRARLAFLEVNPFGVAYDVLAGGAVGAGPSPELRVAPEDRETVEMRLERLGPVEEADYHRFTIRAEVLLVAFAALREQMIADGHGDVTFGPEDYE